MTPDFINGSFELLGSFFIALSIKKLARDKMVRGFHWGQLTFFTTWGMWNLYYYPHLSQWASLVGGVAVTITNVIYLVMIVYYVQFERRYGGGTYAR